MVWFFMLCGILILWDPLEFHKGESIWAKPEKTEKWWQGW